MLVDGSKPFGCFRSARRSQASQAEGTPTASLRGVGAASCRPPAARSAPAWRRGLEPQGEGSGDGDRVEATVPPPSGG